jgi:hypothetical protein
MDASNAIVTKSLQCPYCGEVFDTIVDLSGGTQCYIEDCYACCQPVELSVTVNDEGELDAVTARRDNE